MNREQLLQNYPVKRISPVDGMAVTADVWEEAHNYHRQIQGLQTLLSQGSGIIAGLEVIASDPSDTSVYVLPGIAIDPAGQIIVLPQPVTYDVGHDMQGDLYILLTYGESQPRASRGGDQAGAPMHIQAEFSIAAGTTLPNSPWVELARISRSSRDAKFENALNPMAPRANEIDLRFRQDVGAPKSVSLAVNYLGQAAAGGKHARGIANLAQALNREGRYQVSVEDDVALGPNIATKTLVYLVGQGSFKLDKGVMNGLRNYVQRGKGTLLMESMDAQAEASFVNFFRAVGVKPDPLKPGHRLLSQPHLFTAPPAGFETQGTPKIMVSDGMIFNTFNYGLLWQGERRDKAASREEIRSALEWGDNIVTYALERRATSGRL
ncbi:MAG: DUF4159 domain-containing protein [Chloroflexota bacterium]